MAATCEQSFAWIELSRGDARSALASLERSDAMFAEFGERQLRSTTQALLARVHDQLGAPDSAIAAIELAESLSAPQDVQNFAITHGVRARLALASEDLEAAERWARSAVEFAFMTDFVGYQAEATLALARVLQAHRFTDAAQIEARAALELFSAKGDRTGASASKALLQVLGG
jgi:tetratricopeptide (TPR) repeat protein